MTTLRPLGVGSQVLIHGNKMAGFYGEVTGIITADELRNMTGVAQGNPLMYGDITWLKFSHNYKTLFVAKKPIQQSISWDYLHEKDLVFGKMVEIGEYVYLLRLMQGANSSPVDVNNNTPILYNSEYDKLLVGTMISDLGINENDIFNTYEFAQEVTSNGINNRVLRLFVSVDEARIAYGDSSLNNSNTKWRPVLELLYEV